MALSLKGQPHWIAAQQILRTVCTCVAAILLMAASPRPVPENGANTLALYTGRYPAFSLVDGLEFLKLQLQHFATQLTTVPSWDASSNQIAMADHLVILCPQAEPGLPPDVLAAIASRVGPTLWVGFGIEQLQAFDRFTNRFEVASRAADVPLARVKYQGRAWDAPVYPWMPVALPSAADVVMSGFEAHSGVEYPLCWQKTNFTLFAALPVTEMLNFLFTDMLFDFYDIKQTPPARVFLRIEDYSALSNHRELQRKADYLHSRGMPFMLAVIPTIRDPVTGSDLDLATTPEFADALRYAQARGARLLIRGDSRHEFWDPEQDRGLGPGIGNLKKSVAEFLERGLFPLAWETPEYSASRAAYREIAMLFSTGVERVQLSDSTQDEKATPLGITVDAAGESRLRARAREHQRTRRNQIARGTTAAVARSDGRRSHSRVPTPGEARCVRPTSGKLQRFLFGSCGLAKCSNHSGGHPANLRCEEQN
jgi:uncharacterized protein YdaL